VFRHDQDSSARDIDDLVQIAQLWSRSLPAMMAIAAASAAASGYLGLIASYHLEFASGPTIIMTAALVYLLSILFAPSGLVRRFFPARI